jgi:hypothetical protein
LPAVCTKSDRGDALSVSTRKSFHDFSRGEVEYFDEPTLGSSNDEVMVVFFFGVVIVYQRTVDM